MNFEVELNALIDRLSLATGISHHVNTILNQNHGKTKKEMLTILLAQESLLKDKNKHSKFIIETYFI